MTKALALNTLALFSRASDGDLDTRQMCLGQVEKALTDAPHQGSLLACKAALLVLLAARVASPEVAQRYLRVSMQMVTLLGEDSPLQDQAEMHLMNGLAWAEIAQSPEADAQALRHLQQVTQASHLHRLEPIDQLAAWAALSVLHQEAGQADHSRQAFAYACDINRPKAITAFERLIQLRARPMPGTTATE